MEAITSRALLLAGVGGQACRTDYAVLDADACRRDKRAARIAHIRAALGHVSSVAKPLPQAKRWKAFVDDGVAKITRPPPPWLPPEPLALTG